MTRKVWSLCAGLALATVCTGPAAAQNSATEEAAGDILLKMLSGQSVVDGEDLRIVEEAASAYPLGSAENPVRAEMPQGQRAYLARLRCPDLTRPEFSRAGSAGLSPYGNIADIYVVTCAGSDPESRRIYIDMYHRGHIETRAVEGYGIVSAIAE